MKILLFFTFYLISGPVGGVDVIGFPGGSVVIFCKDPQNRLSRKYFCRENPNKCFNVETQESWVHKDRISLFDFSGILTVFYRDLSVEDAGSYQCGGAGGWRHTVNLKVKENPCCLGPKTVIGYLGETVTINCSYPEEFQRDSKTFYKLYSESFASVVHFTESQIDRFSISEDRRSRVVSVRIRDVREDDGEVYYCGVSVAGDSVDYFSFFKKIQLHINAPGSSTIIIITVSIFVVLLLIGGLTLIFYKLRCSRTTEGSASPPNTVTMGNINKVSHSDSDSEKIRSSIPNSDPRSSPNSPTDPLQVPRLALEGPVYTTVSFQKNPGSSTDTSINISKGEPEPDIEYATVKHPTRVK